MFKFIRLALIGITSITLLAACGPSEKDANQFGFASAAEMKDLQAKGFKTKDDYAKSLGFLNSQEMLLANQSGFKTIEELSKAKGFASITEFREAQENKIDNPEAYGEFLLKKQTGQFLKSFITLAESESYNAYKTIPSSRKEEASQKESIAKLDAFINENKNIKLVGVTCDAITYKFAIADSKTPLTCNGKVKIDRYDLPMYAHFELKINNDIANSIGKYYESDKFQFNGTVQKISFCSPFQMDISVGSNCTNVLEINASSVEVIGSK